MKNKKITTVFLDPEVHEHIRKNTKIKNLSEWVNGRYQEEFMDLSAKTRRLKALKEEVAELSKDIETLKQGNPEGLIDDSEREWIKTEGLERWKRMKNLEISEEGIYKFFVNTFKRHDINRRQFRLLMEEETESKNNNQNGGEN